MTFARWGIPTLLWTILGLAWFNYALVDTIAFIPVLCLSCTWTLFTIAFFRNPRRTPAGDAWSFISPADGVVSDITETDGSEHECAEFIGEPCIRIGIFLSVFDVHVNRSPIAGTVSYVNYKPGKFLDARHPDVTHENEANTIGITVDDAIQPGLKILVRQLSGLIARRIICTYTVGEHLKQTDLYGMIKFGSRTELWIPQSCAHTLNVTVGQKVKCGETILAELTNKPLTEGNEV